MAKEFIVVKRNRNSQFVGWAILEVWPGSIREDFPRTIAEFYGRNSKRRADYFAFKLREKSIA